jgi:hypothetical protein
MRRKLIGILIGCFFLASFFYPFVTANEDNPQEEQQKTFGDYHALLVGVSVHREMVEVTRSMGHGEPDIPRKEEKTVHDLGGAPRHDVQQLTYSLERYDNWDVSNIKQVLDTDGTSSNILTQLEASAGNVNPDDVFFFQFSGHGWKGGVATYELDGFITWLDIEEKLKNFRNDGKRVILLSACHAGGFKEAIEEAIKKNSAQYSKSAQSLILMGSHAEQGVDLTYNPLHLMTNLVNGFVLGINGGAKTGDDGNGMNFISGESAFYYALPRIKEYFWRKTPQILEIWDPHPNTEISQIVDIPDKPTAERASQKFQPTLKYDIPLVWFEKNPSLDFDPEWEETWLIEDGHYPIAGDRHLDKQMEELEENQTTSN